MINIIIGEICNKTMKKKKWAEILDNECVTLLILEKDMSYGRIIVTKIVNS